MPPNIQLRPTIKPARAATVVIKIPRNERHVIENEFVYLVRKPQRKKLSQFVEAGTGTRG